MYRIESLELGVSFRQGCVDGSVNPSGHSRLNAVGLLIGRMRAHVRPICTRRAISGRPVCAVR
jgi:hypothetical protein